MPKQQVTKTELGTSRIVPEHGSVRKLDLPGEVREFRKRLQPEGIMKQLGDMQYANTVGRRHRAAYRLDNSIMLESVGESVPGKTLLFRGTKTTVEVCSMTQTELATNKIMVEDLNVLGEGSWLSQGI